MKRRDILEECIHEGRAVLASMKDKSIDRQDADSLFNGIGKILKGVQLHLADEMFDAEKGAHIPSLPGPTASLTHNS